MKKSLLFLFIAFAFMCICGEAYAAEASSIFDNLANKAGAIGKGLRDTGFLIAGFGLIVFSFMAIFNKISWKMLAYIMMSTFILSTMVGIISYISGGQSVNRFPDIQSTGPGSESMDTTQAQIGKEGGNPSYGNGTAPYKLEAVDVTKMGAPNTGYTPEGLNQGGNSDKTQQGGQQVADAGTGAGAGAEQEPEMTEAEKKAAFEAEVKGKVQRELLSRNVTTGLTDVKSSISMAENGSIGVEQLEKFAQHAQDALNYLQSLPSEEQTDYVKNQIKVQQKAIELYNQGIEKIKSKGQ